MCMCVYQGMYLIIRMKSHYNVSYGPRGTQRKTQEILNVPQTHKNTEDPRTHIPTITACPAQRKEEGCTRCSPCGQRVRAQEHKMQQAAYPTKGVGHQGPRSRRAEEPPSSTTMSHRDQGSASLTL